jgi:hypothetical protein
MFFRLLLQILDRCTVRRQHIIIDHKNLIPCSVSVTSYKVFEDVEYALTFDHVEVSSAGVGLSQTSQ